MITIRDATRVVKKFDMEERRAKHVQYKFIWNGKIVLTTALPHGRGPLNCRDKFRNQLYLTPAQLDTAVDCSFKLRDFVENLRKAGLIPEDS